ncbi:DUF1877 family protein [Streptomyces sp. ODS28]|uniref:DUF1877 family protein n=1 Tax=Streptomyces sp. ODS28 TaxID=3136688 RepID=UPI0031EFCDC5
MGFWVTLSRHDAARVDALLDHPDGPSAGRERLRSAWSAGLSPRSPGEGEPALECLEENDDIRRNWDGLHVLLTGCRDHRHDDDEPPCGEAPARDAVRGGQALTGADSSAQLQTPVLLMPDAVRAVRDFLRGLDAHRLLRERADLVERAGVYSFHMTVGLPDGSSRRMSMIEDGSLAASLEGVRGFYARAAAAGNAVIKEIS